ncbi:hypothetical protein MPH_02807 [Macrophomina phaseolina MS6]|uniref:Aminotransferase class IV n=1 Tax=Macrophomina phaseolina (strain MS6) TaxID=1126212 RepID=K2ST37_MACPH|nr:hypothetical protein MPH_02807 [Macrophomina phaseolina MS6]
MAPSLEENEHVGEWHIAAPLDASKLQVTLVNNPKPLPMGEAIAFGKTVTDHMLRVTWTAESGWDTPRITPYGPIVLDPVASGLHYGFECFEGMKAYRDAAGRLRLFRPELNAARLNRSAARISLPTFDEAEFVKLVRMFVKIEGRWVGK